MGPLPKGRTTRLLNWISRRPRRRGVILAGGVIVVLGAAGGGFWATRGSSASTPAYQLVPAVSSTLRQTVSSTGTIEPAAQANLNFAASGQVTSVAATVGEKVNAGQVLATVNSASLAADVAQAKATQSSDAAKLSADQAAGSPGTGSGGTGSGGTGSGSPSGSGSSGASNAQVVVISTSSYVVNGTVDD